MFKLCQTCNKDISSKKKKSKFCSLSCSTKYNRLLVLQKDVPKLHKKCGRCLEIKPFREFRKNKNSAFGYSYFCRKCDKQRTYTRDKRKILFNAAKKRAKDNNINFNLELEDIVLPIKCPILGMELVFNTGKARDNSYSIDRIDSNLGYIKGNIQVISFKANTIKNNASLLEIEKVYLYMKNNHYNKDLL
jgi:hypothetical protein